MPLPQHCIECDKVAVIIKDGVYYCVRCYKEEKEGDYNHDKTIQTTRKK